MLPKLEDAGNVPAVEVVTMGAPESPTSPEGRMRAPNAADPPAAASGHPSRQPMGRRAIIV
jgi:hypothetical protein